MENITYEEFHKLSGEQKTDYWKLALSTRTVISSEMRRLMHIGMGFYIKGYTHAAPDDCLVTNIKTRNFYNFLANDKRPFGNKAIPESIIFNLGWDTNKFLAYDDAPEFVQDMAMEVYNELIEYVYNNINEELWRL